MCSSHVSQACPTMVYPFVRCPGSLDRTGKVWIWHWKLSNLSAFLFQIPVDPANDDAHAAVGRRRRLRIPPARRLHLPRDGAPPRAAPRRRLPSQAWLLLHTAYESGYMRICTLFCGNLGNSFARYEFFFRQVLVLWEYMFLSQKLFCWGPRTIIVDD